MASKKGKKRKETPKLIKEYRRERKRIQSREREIKARGFELQTSYVPEIINVSDFKTREDWGKLKAEINRLKQITPNIIYSTSTYKVPLNLQYKTGAVVSGLEGRELERKKSAQKGLITRKINTAKKKAKDYFDETDFNYEDEEDYNIPDEEPIYKSKIPEDWQPPEEEDIDYRQGDEYAEDSETAFMSLTDTITERIESGFWCENADYLWTGKHRTSVDTDSDKFRLLEMWRNVVDEYSQDNESVNYLIDYIKENEGKIAELLEGVQHSSTTEQYYAHTGDLYAILHVTPPTQAEVEDFWDY